MTIPFPRPATAEGLSAELGGLRPPEELAGLDSRLRAATIKLEERAGTVD